MLQTEESEKVTLNVGTQSDSLVLMRNGDLSLNEGTVNLVNLGMSLEQAHNIRTAICNIL